jgi:acyl-coenzyme A thioesterase PaaI-like protein
MSAELEELVALMPFARQLGIALDEASADRVVARLDWAPHRCTSGGLMHGGALMTLADTAGALVTFLGLPAGATTATITSTRTTVTAQTSLFDADGRLVAQTTQIQAVR